MRKKKNSCSHPVGDRKQTLSKSDTIGSKNFILKVFKCSKCGFYKRSSYTTMSGIKGGQMESKWFYSDKDPEY